MVKIHFSHRQETFHAEDHGGSGPALLLLHGFLEDRRMWQPLLPSFTDSWRVISLDLPGHGESPNLGYQHTMETMAEVLRGLLIHLKIDKVTVVGHSMGGYVALAFAAQYPGSLKGLVVLNSSPWPDGPERQNSRERAIKLVKRDRNAYLRQAIPLLFAPESRQSRAADIQKAVEMAQGMSAQGIIAALSGMKIRPNREDVLRQLNGPVLIAAAQQDPILPHHELQALASDAGTEWLSLPHGHMSHIEAPDALKTGLQAHLKEWN